MNMRNACGRSYGGDDAPPLGEAHPRFAEEVDESGK